MTPPPAEQDPFDGARSKPLMSVGFWISLAFGAACIAAGAAVAWLGAHGAL